MCPFTAFLCAFSKKHTSKCRKLQHQDKKREEERGGGDKEKFNSP